MHYGNVFDPQSPLAGATVHLLKVTLAVCGGIFLLVTVLVFYCMLRYRGRAGAEEPRQVQGHKPLEIVWTVGPFLLLIYLFVLTVYAMHASDPPSTPGNVDPPPALRVIGHQFWWEVRYPGAHVVTANEVHIPVGKPLLVQLEAADVIHDFWVPQLSRKMDMIPGHPNEMWLQAAAPGTYLGFCAEFCGAEHAGMGIRVIAENGPEFEAWEKQQRQEAAGPESAGDAATGAKLFQDLTCASCHSLQAEPPPPLAAPSLTHLASRETLGSGVIQNTPENLGRWIRNSQAIKPGNLMPRFNLTDAQVRDLVAYLVTLR